MEKNLKQAGPPPPGKMDMSVEFSRYQSSNGPDFIINVRTFPICMQIIQEYIYTANHRHKPNHRHKNNHSHKDFHRFLDRQIIYITTHTYVIKKTSLAFGQICKKICLK